MQIQMFESRPYIARCNKRVTVKYQGLILADTRTSIIYYPSKCDPPIYYLDCKDVRMEYLVPGESKGTDCKHRGELSLYNVKIENELIKERVQGLKYPTPPYYSLMGRIAFYPTPFSAFIDDEPVCPFSGDNPGWVSNENRVKLLALAKSDDPPVHTRVYNYFHKRHRLYLARKMLQEFNNVITSLPGYNNPAATSFTLSRIFDLPHDGGSLYLSGAGGAKDLVSLKNVGITAILNVAHDDTNTGEDYYTSSNAAEKVGYAIQYKGVSCTDSPAFNIRDRFEECFEFLDRELKQIKDPAQSKKGRKSKKSRFGLTKTKETENDGESGSKTVTTGTTVTQNSVGASLSSNTIPRTSTPNTTTVLQQTRTGYSAQLTSISDTESPDPSSSSPQLPLTDTTTPTQPTQQMSSSPSQHPFSAPRPQPPKILIHCSMGISRSATVLIAYLCRTYKLSLKDAVKLARTNRNLVCPNMGFRIQLIEFCIENKLKLW